MQLLLKFITRFTCILKCMVFQTINLTHKKKLKTEIIIKLIKNLLYNDYYAHLQQKGRNTLVLSLSLSHAVAFNTKCTSVPLYVCACRCAECNPNIKTGLANGNKYFKRSLTTSLTFNALNMSLMQ